jgi:ribosome maturation factor RimP
MDVDVGKRRRKRSERDDRAPSKPLTDSVRARIEGWAEEAADVYGLELFDVEITPQWKIGVFVDKEGGFEPGKGVTIDECAEVSRYVEALLDTDDDVPEKYTIEVSSPGVERKLSKPRHFAKVVGRSVRVVVHVPVDGQNVFEGELIGFDDPELTIDVEGTTHTLTLGQLAKARLTYEF